MVFHGPGEKSSPGDLQGSPSPSSNLVHPNKQAACMKVNKELLTEVRHKKGVYKSWKRGQVTQEEYRDNVQLCRDGVRKAKAHLEMNLVKDVRGNGKGFYQYISNKRKTRENMDSLLNGAVPLLTEDTEKAKILSAFFTSVFSGKTRL